MTGTAGPGAASASRAAATNGFWLRLLPVLGLAFWFGLGFPFGNHNESYDWVVRLDRMGFVESLGRSFPTVANHRPLGTGLAWIAYRLGGGSIVLAQVLNFALAAAAWLWLATAIPERRLFGLLALIAGGVFFAGYIFLFHLHGIFYGPLLLLAAAAFVAWRAGPHKAAWLFPAALVAMLVHPFALLLWLAFAVGAAIEWPSWRTPRALAWLAASCALAIALGAALGSGTRFRPEGGVLGLLVSYRMVEVHALVSLAALGLAAVTLALGAKGPLRLVFGIPALIAGAALFRMGLPLLPLWIAACVLKAAVRGWWIPAALLGAAFLLPWFNPSGSPTYAVFALALAAAVTAVGEPEVERRLGFVNAGTAAAAILGAGLLLAALRAGVAVPGIARLAAPVVAERERTAQLEALVGRLLDSPWRDHPVRLWHAAEDPRVAADALDRRHRAPTQENHFESYVNHRRGGPPRALDTLLVTFGGEVVPGAHPVVSARGRHAGDAVVFEPDSNAAGPGRAVPTR